VNSPPPPGGPPPPPGNPYPPQGYSGSQQPWPAQQPWSPGLPPKHRGGAWKWLLGAVALLVVIGVTVAVTISVTQEGADGPGPAGETFGLASADDKGPANIITEDPSCAAWSPISQTFINIERSQGWNNRNPAIPATEWTPQQRSQFDKVAQAARDAADQTVAVAKATPHRVMRELYEQFIAYARAYSDTIPHYTPADDHLARVFTSSASVIANICKAITYGSAETRAPLVSQPDAPETLAQLRDPDSPTMFVTDGDPLCADWFRLLDRFDRDTKGWQALDPALSAADWTPEQRATIDATIPVMEEVADEMEALGRATANPIVQDLATLAAQYRRAYAAALPSYTIPDSFLSGTASETTSMIWEACKALEG